MNTIVINAGDLTIEEVIGLSNTYDVVLADGKICFYPKKEKANEWLYLVSWQEPRMAISVQRS